MAATANNSFWRSDYLVLHPEKTSLLDLFVNLCSQQWSHFVHYSSSTGSTDAPDLSSSLSYRWLVFVSVAVQKILMLLKKPMAEFGNMLEDWLNLVQSNDGFLKLCFNKIRGKVVRPLKDSDGYKSVIGFMDSRLSLDQTIPIEDGRYLPQLAVMACKLTYENPNYIQNVVENQWQMKSVLGLKSYWNAFQEKHSTQAFICQATTSSSNLTVVGFRGTETFNADDWSTDADISWFHLQNVGRIHAGFSKALGLQQNGDLPKEIDMGPGQPEFAYYTIRQELIRTLSDGGDGDGGGEFILTGHSLGGALAILFVAFLIIHEEEELLKRLVGVYTFGQPRVGDQEFGDFMEKNFAKYKINYHRYVYCNDMVPRMPFDNKTMLFKHFGTCFYSDSLYRRKVLGEAKNKNYFSLFWLVLACANACWELCRGLIYLPWRRGFEFQESWSLIVLRCIGLIIPGFSAHCLQDYHNSVYLQSSPLPFGSSTYPKDEMKHLMTLKIQSTYLYKVLFKESWDD